MRARSSERGFTLPELVMVIIMVGLLAAVAMPRLQAGLNLRDDAWHDELVSALRYAHQTAVSHRRLVCATVGSSSVSLSIASTNPATACDTALNGPDGSSTWASSGSSGATLSPAGTIFFQPNGRATSDGAGATASDRSIGFSDAYLQITLVGETGHVE